MKCALPGGYLREINGAAVALAQRDRRGTLDDVLVEAVGPSRAERRICLRSPVGGILSLPDERDHAWELEINCLSQNAAGRHGAGMALLGALTRRRPGRGSRRPARPGVAATPPGAPTAAWASGPARAATAAAALSAAAPRAAGAAGLARAPARTRGR